MLCSSADSISVSTELSEVSISTSVSTPSNVETEIK